MAASLVFVAALVDGSPAIAAADGYQRQPIQEAKISILIPDDWTIYGLTRKEVKQILKQNPDLKLDATEITDSAFDAKWDGDGDGYPDRWMDVNVARGVRELPTPTQAEADFAANLPQGGSAEAKRGSVAGKEAIVTTFGLPSIVRDDGSSIAVTGTQYAFIGKTGVVLLGFYGIPGDSEFERVIGTMIRSVKLK